MPDVESPKWLREFAEYVLAHTEDTEEARQLRGAAKKLLQDGGYRQTRSWCTGTSRIHGWISNFPPVSTAGSRIFLPGHGWAKLHGFAQQWPGRKIRVDLALNVIFIQEVITLPIVWNQPSELWRQGERLAVNTLAVALWTRDGPVRWHTLCSRVFGAWLPLCRGGSEALMCAEGPPWREEKGEVA